MATCQEKSGDLISAARSWQRAYYDHPFGRGQESRGGHDSARQQLGSKYPPVSAEAMFTRVDRCWMSASTSPREKSFRI
jgi:hypothetical protein